MATRRKGYRSGGRVSVELPDVAPDIATPEPPAEMQQPAAALDGSPVKQALDDIRRAEALQQQYQQPQQPRTLGQAIDTDPQLTGPQKQFLRQHPEVLSDPRALLFYVNAARSRGIQDDTPEFFQSILDGFAREYERGVEHAKHLASTMARPQAAEEADRVKAEEVISHAQAMLPDVPIPPAETPAMAPLASESRRSVPVSAPVSRDVPTSGGLREASVDTRLTAEERDVARRSYHYLPPAEAEKLYWQMREKLRRARRDGTYRQTTEQTG
jgi:hypothetical protein